jgi:4-phytase/acid phosphatase
MRTLQVILGCDAPGVAKPCDLAAAPGAVTVSADGRGVDLTGPIRTTSGIAQVLMLQYLEGMPLDQVGWGRADPSRLAEVSRLHGLLFDVYSRPDYIAPRVAGALGRRLLSAIEAGDHAKSAKPRLAIFVGHDDNIAAISALLGVHFHMPGYGADDPPIGDALLFEVLRDPRDGARYVRVEMQAQTPEQLRALTPLDLAHPPSQVTLKPPGCAPTAIGLCGLADFEALLSRRLTVAP